MRALFARWRRDRDSEDFAWACLVANALGVPGMGTLMARRWEGVVQLALSVAGGVLMTWWIVAFVIAAVRETMLPPADGPPLDTVLWGLVLFLAGWLWALLSSVLVLQAARRRRPSNGRGA